MNQLQVILASRALRDGRALPAARFRHRHLVPSPLALVLWQLGAEPFSAAAICYGRARDDMHLEVAGDPRNRDMAFRALGVFAHWFNPIFEAASNNLEIIRDDEKKTIYRARTCPQVIVPNGATVEHLGRLGRRLAYLPTEGPKAADPSLVRLGQHLQFLARRALIPGQQIVVSMTELLGDHYVTGLSSQEQMSLAALDAYIEPPAGMHGFQAAELAERLSIGPTPTEQDDMLLQPLVDALHTARNRSTDPAVITRLLGPIKGHYQTRVNDAWDLLWRCRDREAVRDEAPSVQRRWEEDRQAYTDHVAWTVGQSGRRRTRQTARQAATTLRDLEAAQARLAAEEACDDPIRMIPYILANKAIRGEVSIIDLTHKEIANVLPVLRPLVTIRTPDACLLPVGKELWWDREPKGSPWVIEAVTPALGGGSDVMLKLTTSRGRMPSLGEVACFSIHKKEAPYRPFLPVIEPWTHLPAQDSPEPHPIEDTEE